MKLTSSLSLLVCASVAAAARVSRRGLASSGDEFASQEYDYVVVGGGTAGLVVAARLAEDPSVTVGVIEAGEYRETDALMTTPISASQLQRNTSYDWMFTSTPQPNLKDQVLNIPRGKVLGGSSAIGLMIFGRAPKAEYDAWASLGNPGWTWNALLPYMKAAEHFTDGDPFRVNNTTPDPKDVLPSQGTHGPIAAGYSRWYSDVVDPYVKTSTSLGILNNHNPDNGNPYGTINSARSVNRTTGQRSYAANTYYAYNAHLPNFVVLTGAQATKVEFDTKENKGNKKVTATGVSFMHNSTSYSVKAKKEVILSAGSIKTPQLLELSGIGNSEILKQYGIESVVDLPGVGENLQDHLRVATTYELKPGVTTWDALRINTTYAAAAREQYASTKDGILSSSITTLSFISLDTITSPEKVKAMTAEVDKEISSDSITQLQKAQYVIQKEWLKKKQGHLEIILNPIYFGAGTAKNDTQYFTLAVVPQHPFSRGSIHINSSDPLVQPQIDPKYLSKSIDQDSLVEAVKFCSKFAKTEPIASLVVGRQDPPESATSDEAITDYVKGFARSIHQQIGTAAMAPRDIGGVVDKELKVYGTANLRVVDASIIPMHMSAHIMRTVYGIAERAATMIAKKSK